MPTPSAATPTRARSAMIVVLCAFAAGILGFASIGEAGMATGRVSVVLAEMVYSGWMPMLYLLGAYGCGSLFKALLPESAPNHALCLSIGITLMLTLTHLLGITGLLTPISAWIATGVGIILALRALQQSRTSFQFSADRSTIALFALLAIGASLYAVASASPPGALWDSEFVAYDSLSYHLQLPKEWIANGQIWPSEHNVYSFHPGYIESAYMHMALLGNQQVSLQSTHFLSVLLVFSGAWGCVHAVRQWGGSVPVLGGCMVVLTPWVLVVGSMSYNEAGVIAMGAGAMIVASRNDLSPSTRGLLAGILVAGACGCKMTAIFFLAPSVAVLLLASTPRKSWLPLIAVGGITGIAVLSPWLIRNAIASGNPIFPHASTLFGSGHWSTEQLARFASAHHFDGAITDRLSMLVLPDQSAPAAEHVSRFRGLTNLQWGVLPIATLGVLAWLIAWRTTRRLGFVFLFATAIPIIVWMTMTHLQSRFFVPMVPLSACIVGVGFQAGRPQQLRFMRPLALVLCTIALGWCASLFASQNQGMPNALLNTGSGFFTRSIRTEAGFETFTWTAALNESVDANATVYLIGDSAPLYLQMRILYNTTYDTPAIASFVERFPGEPARWIHGLAGIGVDWIVINTSELGRLTDSGWIDPSISPQHITQLTDTLQGTPTITLDPFRTAYQITDFPAP